MTGRTKEEQSVISNLVDAGCGSELIERFMNLLENGEKASGLTLLAKHRRCLMDCYHADQKRIDCLDYLIYRLRN